MIHDFATLPRTQRQTSRPVPPPAPRRLRRPALLLVVLLAGFACWKLLLPDTTPEPEFVPGASEAREYQSAMELEAAEATVARNAGKQGKMATSTTTSPAKPQSSSSRAVNGKSVASKPAPVSPEVAAFQEKLKSAQTHEPQFGFYDSLSGSAWSVPVQRGIYITEEDRKRAGYRYLLQAASVRDLAEAQRLVQKLRGMGMEASLQNADPAGSGWYRVNVGPFDNVSKMNKAEDILVSMHMMPLKRRIP